MRTNTTLILAWIAILAFVGGCNGTEQPAAGPGTADKTPPAASSTPPAALVQAPTTEGEVLETMNSGGYTYVKVDTGEGPNWYAGPQTQVAVGETVALPKEAMPMRNFTSNTLGRTFDLVYFVGSIRKTGGTPAAPAMQNPHGATPAVAPSTDFADLEKAEGGMTVAEIYAVGANGAGKDVILRGKVVKYNSGIMGKNWLHVRDGTGEANTGDITITTLDTARVGDTVLVTGKLVADRDFGAGYKYPLLIEDAKVVVE